MKNRKIENFIEDIKKVSLKKEEKAALFAVLKQYTKARQPNQESRNISTWPHFHFLSYQSFRYALASLLIFTIAGGTTVFASESALPGDILYPIKINISEPLKVAIAFSADKKEKVEIMHIEERLKEVEVLALEGRLSTTTIRDIKSKVEKKIKSTKEKSSKKNLDDLDTRMSAHSIILNSIKEHSDEDQRTSIEDIQEVVNQNRENTKKNEKTEKVENKKESNSERRKKVEQDIEKISKKVEKNIDEEKSFERSLLESASSSINKIKDRLKRVEDGWDEEYQEKEDKLIEESEENTREVFISVERGLELSEIRKESQGEKKRKKQQDD